MTRPLRVGVTGTNGKTTTTTLIAAIAEAAGETSARVTTLGTFVGGERLATEPTLEALHLLLARAEAANARAVAIETSSQALAEGFAQRFPADIGVFTNLSRDHLDYHATFEHYLASKAQLFVNLTIGGTAVLNAADQASALLADVTNPGARVRAYAGRPPHAACANQAVDLAVLRVNLARTGTRVRLADSPLAKALGGEIALKLIGEVHAENALAAAVAADALGFDATSIRRGLEAFPGVPGRFQIVREAPLVVVDYAHTPDALDRTLALASALARRDGGRLLCVFGCGGDRDAGKREPMGRVAASLADHVVITTDNPRSEDPKAIAEAILRGTGGGRATVECIADRAEAITRAVRLATERCVVVVAGKGHETTQIIGDRVVAFDDAEVARGAR